MSRLAEFRKLEEQLALQLAELEAMKSDGSLQREMEFEDKLRALMAEYDVNLPNLINILDPQAKAPRAAASTDKRRERKIKLYKNPHTGEVVETKGGNHKVLKAWKAEFGNDEVESWVQA
ncbi:histone-like nucleoid-structuring protein, MvaT/MvaU family [Stutzerimonas kunmingensis]|uniref:DNA binding protein n=1 Tax=Stutzerimonas kunmingensis TaxID=1211807 RepID=A0A9X1N4C0_9GAMM|nr:histone-like nucleoid-structuring protein, MvaT/MvaU family [Stutzerimonas kunmingensis]MCD1608607.1 DNA binding protein [Stutzerimonas kunmingensis]